MPLVLKQKRLPGRVASASACAEFAAVVCEREPGWSLHLLAWPVGGSDAVLARGRSGLPSVSCGEEGQVALLLGDALLVFPPRCKEPTVRRLGCAPESAHWINGFAEADSLAVFFRAADADGVVLASANSARSLRLGDPGEVRLFAASTEGAVGALLGPPYKLEVVLRGRAAQVPLRSAAGHALGLALSSKIAVVGRTGRGGVVEVYSLAARACLAVRLVHGGLPLSVSVAGASSLASCSDGTGGGGVFGFSLSGGHFPLAGGHWPMVQLTPRGAVLARRNQIAMSCERDCPWFGGVRLPR